MANTYKNSPVPAYTFLGLMASEGLIPGTESEPLITIKPRERRVHLLAIA